MTFVRPYVRLTTPEARKAAVIRLRALGIGWCDMLSPLEKDLATLASHERLSRSNDMLSHLSMNDAGKAYVFERRVSPNGTLVNSVDHLIAYLRRHGRL